MIEIDISPYLINTGSFLLSWHGFFTFVAVAMAVYLVGRWAPMKGIDPDDIYSIAIWAILAGIIGARLVHVIDNWGYYQFNLLQILFIWSGGIGVWGAILGGFLGGAAYCYIAKHPIGIIADLTAPALLLVQSVGRIGDIVNGEHCARAATDFILAFNWVSDDSDARVLRQRRWCASAARHRLRNAVELRRAVHHMGNCATSCDRTACYSRCTCRSTRSDASWSHSCDKTRYGRWACRKRTSSPFWCC